MLAENENPDTDIKALNSIRPIRFRGALCGFQKPSHSFVVAAVLQSQSSLASSDGIESNFNCDDDDRLILGTQVGSSTLQPSSPPVSHRVALLSNHLGPFRG
jgi:hypothetical protein